MKNTGDKGKCEELIVGTKGEGRLEYRQEPGWLEIRSTMWQLSLMLWSHTTAIQHTTSVDLKAQDNFQQQM